MGRTLPNSRQIGNARIWVFNWRLYILAMTGVIACYIQPWILHATLVGIERIWQVAWPPKYCPWMRFQSSLVIDQLHCIYVSAYRRRGEISAGGTIAGGVALWWPALHCSFLGHCVLSTSAIQITVECSPTGYAACEPEVSAGIHCDPSNLEKCLLHICDDFWYKDSTTK
jgi:hypothetical protein